MISRRDVLKYGMATAALSGVSSRRADADDGGAGKSPFKTQPFVDALPIPPIKQPLNDTPTTNCLSLLSGSDRLANPGGHQFIERPDFQPIYAYEIHVKEAYQRFHPAIPPTRIWGYDGMAPGPLFHTRYHEPIKVRFFN